MVMTEAYLMNNNNLTLSKGVQAPLTMLLSDTSLLSSPQTHCGTISYSASNGEDELWPFTQARRVLHRTICAHQPLCYDEKKP